ncbi:hypothetical protein J6590_015750 [Homalodisca vitripennis]|nr:hypothetical protein J6590_015750 [Homalodisca vitripennis]
MIISGCFKLKRVRAGPWEPLVYGTITCTTGGQIIIILSAGGGGVRSHSGVQSICSLLHDCLRIFEEKTLKHSTAINNVDSHLNCPYVPIGNNGCIPLEYSRPLMNHRESTKTVARVLGTPRPVVELSLHGLPQGSLLGA